MIRFRLDGEFNRLARRWASGSTSWRAGARAFALKHGAAGAWRADGSFVLYYLDGATVRQETWTQATPINA